jgi:hypothetical protein
LALETTLTTNHFKSGDFNEDNSQLMSSSVKDSNFWLMIL